MGCRLWGRTESDTIDVTWQKQQQQQQAYTWVCEKGVLRLGVRIGKTSTGGTSSGSPSL